jgi:hypothetical protein
MLPALARLPEPIATCQMGGFLHHSCSFYFLTSYLIAHLSYEEFFALLDHICSHIVHRNHSLDLFYQICAIHTLSIRKCVLQLQIISIVEVISKTNKNALVTVDLSIYAYDISKI